MYYAIKFAPLTSGPNTGVDFPEVVGPFATADEQKAWIRNEHRLGRLALWLDVKNGIPDVGLAAIEDGSRKLCGVPENQKSVREKAVWDAIFAAAFAKIWSTSGTRSMNDVCEEASYLAGAGIAAWRIATHEGKDG